MVAVNSPGTNNPRVDPLGLPAANTHTGEWRKGQVIYAQDTPAPGLFVVKSGVVRLTTITEDAGLHDEQAGRG